MRSHSEIISRLTDSGVIAILRLNEPSQASAICQALIAGGLTTLEITMTTPGALDLIRKARAQFGQTAVIGVGTVTSAAMCHEALEAGAEFVVTPICQPEIATVTRPAGRPLMMGAYTPTEAHLAHEAGADFIKIFPADTLGPGYMKSILAPLPHLKIVPTGGIDLKNAESFLQAGCVAVGLASSLVSRPIVRERNWVELTRIASEFVKLARNFHGR